MSYNKHTTIKTAYLVGDAPVFDPCEKCIVTMTCDEYCKEKLLWNKENADQTSPPVRSKTGSIKVNTKKRRKSYKR